MVSKMREEIKFGSVIWKDQTISKVTRLYFEREEEMWLYYDNVLSEPRKVSLNVRTNVITLADEYVPMKEYRDFRQEEE